MYLHKARTIQTVALSNAIRDVSSGYMGENWYDRAKRRMAEVGVTQEDLKKPLGVETRGAVGHYLTGRRHPTPEQLGALAKEIKTSTDYLLTGETHVLQAGESDAEPAPDESLLALCMQTVDGLLAEMGYPKKNHIWTEKYRSQLVAHAYRQAAKKKGEIDRQDLKEKISLVAKVLESNVKP